MYAISVMYFFTVYVPPPQQYGDFDLLDPDQQMLGTWSPTPENVVRAAIPQVVEAIILFHVNFYLESVNEEKIMQSSQLS